MLKLLTTASALAIGTAFSLATPALADIRVGVATAINPQARSFVPAQPERVLYVGTDVFADERVLTGPSGHIQLVFLDGTVLSVGPDSDLVINKFIYDPQAKTGELAVNAVRGVFRLVGGKISKTSAIEVRTPKVVLGLRGGIATFNVHPDRPVQAIFLYGRDLTVTSEGVTRTAFRPGSMIETAPGSAPSEPRPATTDEVGHALSHFTGPRKEEANAPAPGPRQVAALNAPTPSDADNGKLDAPAEKVGDAKPAAEADSTKAVTEVALPGTDGTEKTAATATETKADVVETGTITVVDTRPAPTPVPPATVPRFSGRFLRDSPITTFGNLTLTAPRDPANNAPITADVIGGNVLRVTGADGVQDFAYLPGSTLELGTTNATTLFGGSLGFGLVTADEQFAAYLFYTPAAEIHAGVFAGVATPAFPTAGFGRHEMIDFTSDIPFGDVDCITVNCGARGFDTMVSPLYSAYSPVLTPAQAANSNQRAVHMQASLGIVGSGPGQTSFLYGETGGYFMDAAQGDVALGGGARGSLRRNGLAFSERSVSPVSSLETGSGNAIFGPDANYMVLGPERMNPTPGGLAREATAGFKQPFDNLAGFDYYPVDVAISAPADVAIGASRTTQTLSGFVGGMRQRRVENINGPQFLDADFAGQATINTDAASNRMSASFSFGSTAGDIYAVNFGDLTGPGVTGAFIDDNLFAARESDQAVAMMNGAPVANSRLFMVTANAVPVVQIDGVTPCACEFLKWGWWTGDVRDDTRLINDRVHLSTWVAGVAPAVIDLPTTGIATFNGHAIGNVLNNGAQYVAAGNYTQTWNFAARAGLATISGFDAQGSGVPGGITVSRDVSGPGTAFAGGTTGNLISGQFFRDTTASSGVGVGGVFSIANPAAGYQAAGTFAAQQTGALQ
jgi:FecR protein